MNWRRTRVRVAAMVSAAMLAALALTACGSSDDKSSGGGSKSDKPLRIAHFVGLAANTYNQASVKGADAAAAKQGNVKVQVFSADLDPNRQIQQIQTAAASGQYDAFVVQTVNGVTVVPAIKQAAAKGITITCAFAVCGPDQSSFSRQMDELASQSGINAGRLGTQAAPVVGEACRGKSPCNLVIMAGVPGLGTEKPYLDNLKAGLKRFPNVKVVATGLGGYLAEPSYKAMKDILQAHSDVDAVVGLGDQMIVGSEQALREAGKSGVALIGDGASEIAVKAIREGRWYGSSILRPYNDGYVAMTNAIKAARGEQVPPLVDSEASPEIPGGVITSDNVDKWKPEWAG